MKQVRISTTSSLNTFGRIGSWLIGGGLIGSAVAGAAIGAAGPRGNIEPMMFIVALSVPAIIAGFALLLVGRDLEHQVSIGEQAAKPARDHGAGSDWTDRPSTSDWERTKGPN